MPLLQQSHLHREELSGQTAALLQLLAHQVVRDVRLTEVVAQKVQRMVAAPLIEVAAQKMQKMVVALLIKVVAPLIEVPLVAQPRRAQVPIQAVEVKMTKAAVQVAPSKLQQGR